MQDTANMHDNIPNICKYLDWHDSQDQKREDVEYTLHDLMKESDYGSAGIFLEYELRCSDAVDVYRMPCTEDLVNAACALSLINKGHSAGWSLNLIAYWDNECENCGVETDDMLLASSDNGGVMQYDSGKFDDLGFFINVAAAYSMAALFVLRVLD